MHVACVLQCVVCCTINTGLGGERFRLRHLVRDYSHPLPSAASDETLTQLRGMLRRLDDGTAGALAQRLMQRPKGVEGGVDAVKEHASAIKVG